MDCRFLLENLYFFSLSSTFARATIEQTSDLSIPTLNCSSHPEAPRLMFPLPGTHSIPCACAAAGFSEFPSYDRFVLMYLYFVFCLTDFLREPGLSPLPVKFRLKTFQNMYFPVRRDVQSRIIGLHQVLLRCYCTCGIIVLYYDNSSW